MGNAGASTGTRRSNRPTRRRAVRRREVAEFAPIPQPGGGRVALQIYPPGTWFDATDYAVFVGGCGVGHHDTMAKAEAHLFEHAKAYCLRRVNEAEAVAAHYLRAFTVLVGHGLTTGDVWPDTPSKPTASAPGSGGAIPSGRQRP